MNNLQALKSLCNAICNTFYPDHQTLEFILTNEGIDPNGEMISKDKRLLETAIILVKGYVEGSRSENGVSTSVRTDSINESIKIWCREYEIDNAEDYYLSTITIENGSMYW